MSSSSLACLVVDDDTLSRNVIESYIERHDGLTLQASHDNAVDAANALQESDFDLVFLDVEMPDMSGLELLRSLSDHPQVVLVTVKEDYAVEAFNVEVTDYLVKPVRYARFLKAVERVQRRIEQTRGDGDETPEAYAFIKVDGRLVKLDLRAVQWIEAQGDYARIQAGDKSYMVHTTMKSLQKNLPSSDFARVHRSYIVRIDQIKDIEDATIVIERKVIPIGSSYKEALMDRLTTL